MFSGGRQCICASVLGTTFATMKTQTTMIFAWGIFCIALSSVYGATPTAPAPALSRQKALIHLVRQDCGACHGLTLKGGLGSPLLPDALRDKPDEVLEATILHGRPGTAMPGWAVFLIESEVKWIVRQLKAGFPQE